MAVYLSEYVTDLGMPPMVYPVPHQFAMGDNNAYTFTALLCDHRDPDAELMAGTVSGELVRPDGQTVALEGVKGEEVRRVNLDAGGMCNATPCSVTLPQACFAYPGRVTLTIKLTDGTTITQALSVSAVVVRTSTDVVVDPGEVVPDIGAIQAAAAEALSAAAEATAAADHAVRYDTAQTLTDAQKSQALTNIGGANLSEADKAIYADAEAVYNGRLTNTGSAASVWFDHLFSEPANEGHLYAIMYSPENIRGDVKYYARITANYTDGTAAEVARVTALNKPFYLFLDARKTVANYSVVCNRSDTSASGSLTASSSWGLLVFSSRMTGEDNILRTLNDKSVLFNVAGYMGTNSATTKWLDYFIPASVTDFWIRFDNVAGRTGTPAHLARVVCYYTNNTNEITYFDTIGEPVHIVSDSTKTVDHWSLVLYTAASNAYTATKWRIIVWQEPVEPFLQRLAELLQEPDVLQIEGAAYGPVSRFYKAATTSENWQSASYANLNGIPGGGYKYVYAVLFGRHGIGKRAGAVQFFDTNGTSIKALAFTAVEAVPGYPITQAFEIPDGTATINASFEGISNATAAGQASVIGEVYYVRDCYIFLTNTPILNSRCNWLDSEWSAAVDTARAAQGTAFTFGIQTDTHFAPGYPLFVGKQLNQYAKLVGLDFIANLGDIIRGYSGSNYPDSPANMRLAAKTIMARYTEAVPCPFFVTIGNHEKNTLYADDHTGVDPFTQDELYAMFTKQSINTSARIVPEPGKSYYYADLNGFRVVCLFTNDKEPFGYNISAEQISWFTTKALDTSLPVLVLAHVPLVQGMTTAYSETYAEIVSALEAFKTAGGTVIACIYGHTHEQSAQKVNGIWHICCTWSETQFTTAEIFMVDPSTYNITTIGIGKAESRTFEH